MRSGRQAGKEDDCGVPGCTLIFTRKRGAPADSGCPSFPVPERFARSFDR